MAKLNKKEADKKYFDRYKNTGKREENKKKRQEREEKRIAKLKEKAKIRRSNKTKSKKINNENNIQITDPYITKKEIFEEIYQAVLSGKYKVENDWLSPYKRAKKIYKQRKILNTLMPDYCKDHRNYGWWKSKFDKLRNEARNEERMLKLNVGKITIEGRKEMKMYE